MPVQKPAPHKSLVGQALKNYRKSHGITQEQLAEDLGKDARTIRAWENEQPPKSTHELRRISDLLGIEPEHFGLTTSLYIPRTPEEIEEIIVHVWSLMDEVRVSEAFALIERLVQDLRPQIVTQDPRMLRSFAHVLQVAGYVNSMRARTSEVFLAIDHYHEMESIARIINDPTLLNIALTYQGDMYRRQGEIQKALTYLEAARDTTPQADAGARGNGLQLLGRVSLLSKDVRGFEYAMAGAEELASTIDPAVNSIHGHYNLGTVYEEYAKSYAALGQKHKALEYVKRTKAALPKTPNNRILLMIVRAEALIYGGEIDGGEPLAVEAARLSRIQGHHRRLERIQNIKRYLHQQALKFGKAEMGLDEALNGPTEQWTHTQLS
jgi:transcriptional regulator with XRE-family HTH domain